MAALLNLTQAAKQAGVSRGTLYRAIKAGQLPAAAGGRPGRLTLIDPAVLRDWCAREGLHIPDVPAVQDPPPSETPEVAVLIQHIRDELTGSLHYFTQWVESAIDHAQDRLLERLVAQLAERSERLERLERAVERLERAMGPAPPRG
ncbi:MAG: helix-turn-helix domain-containing protein, partial [Candidatus Tectomicrobia bacterium]|nr:helix-turn-helix domain-containing protein [Candidatus Tectomicrobia bacterium]